MRRKPALCALVAIALVLLVLHLSFNRANPSQKPKHLWSQRKKDVFIAIKSAPRNSQRRLRVRQCVKNSSFPYRFFVGVPLSVGHELHAHNQGGHNTAEEKTIERDLAAEQDAHGDIYALPMRDTYMNLPNKLLGVLTYSYYVSGAAYLVVHDDDFCLDDAKLAHALTLHQCCKQHFYAGTYMFRGTEYTSMRGPANMVAPYYSGGYGTILSRSLVWNLVRPETWLRHVMWGNYGTSADDCDMGKWVLLAQRMFNISVQMEQISIVRQ